MTKKYKYVQCPECHSTLFDYKHGSYNLVDHEQEDNLILNTCAHKDLDIMYHQTVECSKCGTRYTVHSLNGKITTIDKD